MQEVSGSIPLTSTNLDAEAYCLETGVSRLFDST